MIISNSSPLIHLTRLGKIDYLITKEESIIIPTAVYNEVRVVFYKQELYQFHMMKAELPFYNIELDFLIEVIRRTYKKFYSLARPKFIFKQFLRSTKSTYRRDKLRNLGKDFHSSLRMLESLSEKRF